MIRSLVTHTARRGRGGDGGKGIMIYSHRHVTSTTRGGASGGFDVNCRVCRRSFSAKTTTLSSATIMPMEAMTVAKKGHASVRSTLAFVTALSLAIGKHSSAITHAEESSGSTDEEEMYADWDDFMFKSISPGEDDDDDDDEEDEEDDDDGEENAASGPADETEDVRIGDDVEEIPVVDADDTGDDNDISTQQDTSNDADSMPSVSSTEDQQPQGPADADEDSGLGYETPSSSQSPPDKDMYEHLENEDIEDEPTTCTICLINRQGPCRPLWRKFEHCMKDHGASNSDDEKKNNGDAESAPTEGGGSPTLAQMCDRYMLPWLNCIQNHRNTYTLITNGFYRDEFVDPMEMAVKEEDKVLFVDGVGTGHEKENSIDVDLGHWWEYAEAQREQEDGDVLIVNDDEEDQILEEEILDKAEQEAKQFLQEKMEAEEAGDAVASPAAAAEDPFLVNVYAKFNLRDPSTNRLIDIAYVRDQDGRLLGFDQFSKEKTASAAVEKEDGEEVENNNSSDGDVNVEDEKDDGGGKTGNCMFHIKPGETASIKLFAIYRESGNKDKEDEDMSSTKVEETLYFSSPISLEQRPEEKD
uniref:GCK domain-containing protein n=1 Tax=Ditylum brightwellii TaxID=49249 RepID=A0A7S2EX19_9STRA|mmetsp:Transcript_9668/g.14425  ORF Transcript_9668/g.14425 Transcript_9668/m.14425 type:complete len:585 (+) Transcript_9668:79-1833(+)